MVVNKEEDFPYMKEYNNKINNNKEIYNKIIFYDTDGVMLWMVKDVNQYHQAKKKKRNGRFIK